MEILKTDERTGIQCGINDQGDLFLGNDSSGYNLEDTPENRARIMRVFERYTK